MRIVRHESGRELRLKFWFFGWFGELFAPSGEFEGLWGTMKIRPSWWRFICRIIMFVQIVFRYFQGVRILPDVAWKIACLCN